MNVAARNFEGSETNGAPATLVYGLGGTGLSVARYLRRKREEALFLDSREHPPGIDELLETLPGAPVMLGSLDESRLGSVARIIVSPGIPDSDSLLTRLRLTGADVVSDIDIFVGERKADFVAVTGSNGKSTVTTLIARMCDAAGMKALAGGNLGHAALDLLAEPAPGIYVLELSSFQLQRTASLPASVAVLLNISPDHLDWHADEAEYRAAKYRVFREARAAVFNREDGGAVRRLPAGIPAVSFGLDAPDEGHFGLVEQRGVEWLAQGASALMPAREIALVGRHNVANALAAMAAGDLLGLPIEPMLDTLRSFAGLPHRMQFVGDIDGVRYINDSKATNVGAAVASVCSVDTPVVLLAGGQGKGGDFQAFARAVSPRLRAVVLFGEDAGKLADAFEARARVVRCEDLDSAFDAARALAVSGDTVLLAPACASFDQFPNFTVRGDAFVNAVGRCRQ